MTVTEEILHKILGEDLVYWPHNVLAVCEKYHQERLESSLPSEQEIENLCVSYIRNSKERIDVATSYKQGFKDALTLLTKGDR